MQFPSARLVLILAAFTLSTSAATVAARKPICASIVCDIVDGKEEFRGSPHADDILRGILEYRLQLLLNGFHSENSQLLEYSGAQFIHPCRANDYPVKRPSNQELGPEFI
ncbi:hypothetical protein DFH09DRAFT_1105401 [Mycena vulgaris]|nr:hypothetical protein DFH09DRAFT_1105401 [Mycena vulgaris]